MIIFFFDYFIKNITKYYININKFYLYNKWTAGPVHSKL